MQHYLLLNQYQNSLLIKKIWRYIATPKIEYLFAHTDLEQDKTSGPILVYGDLTKLIKEYENSPSDWPGIYIRSSATPEQLLKHLRALLLITYPPESKGVLTYYDTRTLHYFFNFTEPEMLATYLGPIQILKWYGSTWLDQQNPLWHEINNPIAPDKLVPLQPYQAITEHQQQGLSLARQHKYIYDWSQKMQISIQEANQYFNQALELGFDRIDYLEQYMTLRKNNPFKALPESLTGSAQQKISYLQHIWM